MAAALTKATSSTTATWATSDFDLGFNNKQTFPEGNGKGESEDWLHAKGGYLNGSVQNGPFGAKIEI